MKPDFTTLLLFVWRFAASQARAPARSRRIVADVGTSGGACAKASHGLDWRKFCAARTAHLCLPPTSDRANICKHALSAG